ncbi:hypothetical protein SAMD00079811_13990 [Scytonema sp. HK-05]|jgi:hypothetical protein|uniref:hypothetical protein n=1 Tax=Scytonema sp. HK-05 TaxID=1137095 RepID=UPI0009358BA6|nr:hypothetical protein [Scytonema sp. HK-05]MBW4502146.1 hypothetical protein [Scytonema hyalinum WJT4-NPBG1]OKH48592.1 hypothetical protein NIES2130_35310 [Scytonema sp. HK-05]BAY43812.1 hypothetical protein SAMD00079811_13990 [Scytonema sp. HK-05]
MAIVHDVDLPDDLYEQLQELAIAENNSINAQVITLLRNALSAAQIKKIAEEQRRKNLPKLLEESRRRREQLPTDVEWPDSTALIREDRDR